MEYTLEQVPQIAEHILAIVRDTQASDHATLITFSGDLGAGKTTLVQEIARQLGVVEDLQSPTFVIYKRYVIPLGHLQNTPQPPLKEGESHQPWLTLIHGDMYRLESAEELEKLGWSELLTDPKNIICIEWPEQVTGALPEWATCVSIHHLGGEKPSLEI